MNDLNALGQPIGDEVPDWTPATPPPHETIEGRWAVMEPLSAAAHGDDLWDAVQLDPEGRLWTYLPDGPYGPGDEAAFRQLLAANEASRDPLFFAIRSKATGRAEGFCSLLRIAPAAGSIEVGFILFGPRLQRTPAATEAMYLLMKLAFDLGNRRYEWKCNALNAPSRTAAMRLGFSYEGVFRQAVVVKGRNRDTAWYAMIDSEWPKLKAAYETWLAPENFDAEGRQKTSLSDLTAPVLVARG